MHYDYLIVGAGLYGAVFAHEMKKLGKTCYVVEKRNHIAGNLYTEEQLGIHVHKYGAHIFHTSDKEVWDYIGQFAQFNHYINSPIAIYKEELYNLPFNMNTFHQMWGVTTPQQAMDIIRKQIEESGIEHPKNLEEQAISLVGTDVYEKLIKGYTEKQWGRACTELPAFIIKRLPLRFTYDNNYFTDPYQGIPIGGYTRIIEKMLQFIPVKLSTSYRDLMQKGEITFDKVLYTGMIDEYFSYTLGHLEYRSLAFEQEVMPMVDNYQGNAVVNYTDRTIPYTRSIEHKHFEFGKQSGTVVTKEYPKRWEPGREPYYPVNDAKNESLYAAYHELAKNEKDVIFGGRLGQYQYFDMDKTIREALELVKRLSLCG